MIIESLTSLLVLVVVLGIVYWVLEKMPEPFGKIAQLIVIGLFVIYILRFFGI